MKEGSLRSRSLGENCQDDVLYSNHLIKVWAHQQNYLI